MTIEQIVQISITAGNILTTIIVAILFFMSKNKTKALTTTASIISTIPKYIENAKNLGLSTSNSILNFVMAEIKDDFTKVLTKKAEKQIKKEVETKINET